MNLNRAIANRQIFIMVLTILMTGVLLLGLLRREKHGIGNIGFESVLILIVYVANIDNLISKLPLDEVD